MLREITLGQYYQVDSKLHHLDPRVKLFGVMVYMVTLFLAKNPFIFLAAGVFLFVCIYLSKVPIKFIVRGLKPIVIILIISLIFNLFGTKGNVAVKFWKLKITYEGILQAIYMGLRLMFLIMGSSLLTLTTTPNSLMDGMERALGFLNYIKIPVHEISMMMSIALRFIPILVEETNKIMKAQQARGADFETGNIIQKTKAWIPVLVPLFVSAIRRAMELANAMEARCYRGGKGRTKMYPLKYSGMDFFAYLVIGAYLAVIILLKIILKQYVV